MNLISHKDIELDTLAYLYNVEDNHNFLLTDMSAKFLNLHFLRTSQTHRANPTVLSYAFWFAI